MNRIVAGIIVVVVIAAIVVAGVLYFVLRDDGSEEAATAALLAAQQAAEPIVRADAIVVPLDSVDLAMPRSGVVDEVLVSENDTVEAGQTLVRIDDSAAIVTVQRAEASLAAAASDLETLEVSIAKERELDDESRPARLEQARLAVRDARELHLHLSGANRLPGAAVSAEGALLEANFADAIAKADADIRQAGEDLLKALGVTSTDDIPATGASIASKAARDSAIAAARLNVFNAQIALRDAEEFDKIRNDAENDVANADALLLNAMNQQNIVSLKAEEDIRVAQEAYDDAATQWQHVHQRYLGITLTEDEFHMSPDALFDLWGADIDMLFDRKNLTFADDVLQDDPSTRWNELKLFGWLALYPFPSILLTDCEGITPPTGVLCIRKDYDDAWSALKAAEEDLETKKISANNAVSAAEVAVVKAQQHLDDANTALQNVKDGSAEASAANAHATLEAADAALQELLDFPDETEVARAQTKLAAAKAARDALFPEPEDIAVAKQQLEDAMLEVSKLERGRDPLDEARREARVSAAEARIAIAEANLDAARIALADYELLAPFAGTVLALDVDAGEEVGARQKVMVLADTSSWELRTSDLDELSVVHLSEGDGVVVTFDALPELEMSGSVKRISRFGTDIRGSTTYVAEILLSGSDPNLRWGMTASIRR